MHTMNNFSKLSQLGQAQNDTWKKFQRFNEAAMADGALPSKTKELIALGTQCSYCLEIHREAAEKAGATREEIAETIWSPVRCGPGRR